MIRRAFVALMTLVTCVGDPSTPGAYLDSALDLLQKHSIESPHADWPRLRAEAHRVASGAETRAQTHGAIRQVIGLLGNPHTFLVNGPDSSTTPARSAPSGTMVGSTAHLVLPGTSSENGGRYARTGLQVIGDLIARRPTAWVVDLRENGGGDMHPMLTVVAPLLGEGRLGSFVFPDGTKSDWGIRAGHVYNGGETAFAELTTPPPVHAPVAVLVNGHTASSGEAVLLSFTGADRTRSFGSPTAGYATANEIFPLADGSRLVITTARMTDRTGRTYGNTPIAPDTPVSTSRATGDRVLDTAIAWLETQRQ